LETKEGGKCRFTNLVENKNEFEVSQKILVFSSFTKIASITEPNTTYSFMHSFSILWRNIKKATKSALEIKCPPVIKQTKMMLSHHSKFTCHFLQNSMLRGSQVGQFI
jgi:hypothetical protein